MAQDPVMAAAEVGDASRVSVAGTASVIAGGAAVPVRPGASVGVGFAQEERRRVRIKRQTLPTVNFLLNVKLPFECCFDSGLVLPKIITALIPFLKCDGKRASLAGFAVYNQ